MKTTLKRSRSSTFARGFTLIEVVVAVGIVATVFVAFMGMLPLGMDTMREAGSMTTQARISQKLVGEVQQTDWRRKGETTNSIVDGFGNEKRYFDEFGNEADSKADAIYQAVVEIESGANSAPTLPGGKQNDYLRQAVIKVAYAPPGLEIDFSDNVKNPKYKRYVTMIADMKKRKSEVNN